jgi:hypothetical protein
MTSTILATFKTVETAQAAINDLTNAGILSDNIGLATYKGDHISTSTDVAEMDDVQSGEGAGFGATVGTVVGAVAGLVAITIPGIGPVIAAGPLAAALGAITGAGIGAVSGAVAGGITAALVNFGVPEEDANYYAESLRRGHALVSVNVTTDAEADRATQILNSHYPIDINNRMENWRESGWTGFDPLVAPLTAEEIARERELGDDSYARGATEQEQREYENATRKYPRNL